MTDVSRIVWRVDEMQINRLKIYYICEKPQSSQLSHENGGIFSCVRVTARAQASSLEPSVNDGDFLYFISSYCQFDLAQPTLQLSTNVHLLYTEMFFCSAEMFNIFFNAVPTNFQ